MMDGLTDLGGGWSRLELTATDLASLPASHDDIGLNLHLGTDSSTPGVMYIDNITGVQLGAPVTPTWGVAALALLLSMLPAFVLGRRHSRCADG
jgi:hypothetical protein